MCYWVNDNNRMMTRVLYGVFRVGGGRMVAGGGGMVMGCGGRNMAVRLASGVDDEPVSSVATDVRETLRSNTGAGYMSMGYPAARKMMHEHANMVDVYGDGTGCLNVEHVFPESMFKDDIRKSVMRADLHNLFMCSRRLNTFRKNFRYVTPEQYAAGGGGGKIIDAWGNNISSATEVFRRSGNLMAVNGRRRMFVPMDRSRGKVARALAYFVVRYDYAHRLNAIIDPRTLIEWNRTHPVDDDEYLKNVVCYIHQGNLNPFIMNPGMVEHAFSDMVDGMGCVKLGTRKWDTGVDTFHTIDHLVGRLRIADRDNKRLVRTLNTLRK